MRRNKQTSIKTETKELLIIRRARTFTCTTWCDGCQAEVLWLSLAETANLSGLREREVFRLVEAGEVHFLETLEGSLLVCPNSLAILNGEKNKILISQS